MEFGIIDEHNQIELNVLLIEDNQDDVIAFKRYIKKEQLLYNCIIAESVTEALNLIDKNDFDIILSDFSLVDGNGFDILSVTKNTPIIVVTGTGNEEIAVNAMKMGAYDYVIKDIAYNYLKIIPSKINKVIESKLQKDNYKKMQIELKNRNLILENNLLIANTIQKFMLPSKMPNLNWIKIDYRYIPYDKIGGDFLSYIKPCKSELGVFIGDVAGNSIPAALFSSLLKSTTEQVSKNMWRYPEKFIKSLNHKLIGNMPSSCLTGTYALFQKIEAENNVKLSFSSGGHPPMIYYNNREKSINFLKSKGIVLGMFEDIHNNEVTQYLNKGDRIFLYTDGLMDMKNKENEMLSMDEFTALFHDNIDFDLSVTLDNIINKVQNYRDNFLPDDDILLTGIEIM